MLRVTQLSTTDTVGGAAVAAKRLHHALLEQGVASTFYVARRLTHDENVVEFKVAKHAPRQLNRYIYALAKRLNPRPYFPGGGLFTGAWTLLGHVPLRVMPAADIYHLHWIAGFVDFRSLPRLARRSPIVWTFHDMNAFTGGCHYDHHCGRFTEQCGMCPFLQSNDSRDATFRTIQRKSRVLQAIPRSRLVVVTPSEWLASEARRSSLFGKFVTRVIPYGIDLSVYKPVDRAVVRARLGFAPDDRVVLFVAENLVDGRKGFRETLETLSRITNFPRLRILTLGNPANSPQMAGLQCRHVGSVRDPLEIRDIYNAADVFIITSLQDNFPNTVVEALACGTPVVGFATGGIIDAVENGVCGLLSATGDIAGLTNCLLTILNDDARRNAMRPAARNRAEKHYGAARQAQAYRALYEEILNGDIDPDAKTSIASPHLP
ncbi:MAG TPA: glycosyltransferase [Chthoniobacterales bacterium]